MDLRKLKTLIDLVSESNVSELEITEAEGKVRIVKGGGAVVQQFVAAPMQAPVAQAPAAAAGTYCWTTVGPLLTMRTLPSASVISSSETLDSETRSIRVLSFRRSM